MASLADVEKKIAEALNKAAKCANILHSDTTDDVHHLIMDYFQPEHQTVQGNSEEEDETDDDTTNSIGEQATEDSELSDADNFDDDNGLVTVDVPSVEVDLHSGVSVSDTDRLKIMNFMCKCKIKSGAVGAMQCDAESMQLKSKCIAQFCVNEVLARRQNMAEFDEGKLSLKFYQFDVGVFCLHIIDFMYKTP